MLLNKMAASMKKPSVSFTLPIACQICLGKVKEPVICSNQHVFCNTCMEVWLQHRSHCPSCRVPITTESPCKQILGGPSCNEDSEKRRSNSELRKMRFEMLHREYEAEIETLQTEVARLRARNSHLEKLKPKEKAHPSKSMIQSMSQPLSSCGSNELKRSQDDTTTREGSSSHSDQRNLTVDNLMLLTQKLKKTSNAYHKLKAEVERVRQDNTQLRDTNAGYLREIGRLKQTITCRSPRKYEKYAQAAQQAKIDKSEQEVKQLKRALERSDVYVEELECKLERYERAHGALEPRTNLSLTLELDSCDDEASRDSIKMGELDITSVPDSPDARDDCATVRPFKMEGDEPAAKKFYSNKGISLLYSPSTSGISRETSLSPDQGSQSKFQESSKSNERAVRSLSDGGSKPSTSCVSSTTPSSVFRHLRLDSDSKVGRGLDQGFDSAAIAAERGSCSEWTSTMKSPRRQLEFDSQTQELSGDRLRIKVTHNVPATSTIAANNVPGTSTSAANNMPGTSTSAANNVPGTSTSAADNSNIRDKREAFALTGLSPGKRKVDDAHDDTLNDLDYTLTDEFLDCAMLLKAAERRIRQRSGLNSDAGNSVGSSSSGSGL